MSIPTSCPLSIACLSITKKIHTTEGRRGERAIPIHFHMKMVGWNDKEVTRARKRNSLKQKGKETIGCDETRFHRCASTPERHRLFGYL